MRDVLMGVFSLGRIKRETADQLGFEGVGELTGAGDFFFADLNEDGLIDTKDLVFMGYPTPDKIGGWQNGFSYNASRNSAGLTSAKSSVSV